MWQLARVLPFIVIEELQHLKKMVQEAYMAEDFLLRQR